MQKKFSFIAFRCILLAVLCIGASACTYVKFPGVYRIVVQQGNIIDQQKVDQLKLGMNKRQVQFVMGTPLVNDAFHEDRWDYIYHLRRGDDTLRERRFTVHFENDQLVSFGGDYEPNAENPVEDTYIEDGERVSG